MLTSDFQFQLPERLIAQTPPAIRGTSRMLALDRRSGAYEDTSFSDLPNRLQPGDLLVLNDSRVLPARLFATRARSRMTQATSPDPSGRIEVLLTQKVADDQVWMALVKPARKVVPGETLHFADPDGATALEAEVIAAGEYGERTLRFSAKEDFLETIMRIGHMPLPPYIHRDRDTPDTAEDKDRYQTVYSHEIGSAAAPTAGLHFTPEVLEALRAKGVEIAYLTLHVGLGTFQPVRAEKVEDIRLHAERYTLSEATAEAVNRARRGGRRIIAAGTTTTRTLEHCATLAPELFPHTGETSIFISPGHTFQIIQGLLTNFHLPQSTLLMLVSAFAGRKAVLAAYAHAVEAQYRFFSYGDCMLIL
ncbi:tRNA preQ1(34) S-adenosylmethionine ribosyltransferase-isomerase QueA [Granulicella sibirica]|uniref:S-adenosylmethionine:tRNA ribosyltransferase-isomerase n=1 Tax=Granulicella sibirica TaxID=2479048 RepID=A0A4Q0SYY2_9BACT|nr:tRNA preQ1(34) S-adenosylmethionine ribosyltransferase-isomerase QueA [Granulicella sibirica]RXH55210.1 S-adenosylmethionine:tRNA ribosyltransferase-isomerase [Granulicella sibirica]